MWLDFVGYRTIPKQLRSTMSGVPFYIFARDYIMLSSSVWAQEHESLLNIFVLQISLHSNFKVWVPYLKIYLMSNYKASIFFFFFNISQIQLFHIYLKGEMFTSQLTLISVTKCVVNRKPEIK